MSNGVVVVDLDGTLCDCSHRVHLAQNKQWRNKCVNDTYEPGSTFKPVTLAAALEEGLVTPNTTFTCTGSIKVQGWGSAIGCSKRSGHGTQSLMVAWVLTIPVSALLAAGIYTIVSLFLN